MKKFKFNDIQIGSQIICNFFTDIKIQALCITKNDLKASFLVSSGGNLIITEKDFKKDIKAFGVELIDETHEKYINDNNTSMTSNFFSKLDEINKIDLDPNSQKDMFFDLIKQFGNKLGI